MACRTALATSWASSSLSYFFAALSPLLRIKMNQSPFFWRTLTPMSLFSCLYWCCFVFRCGCAVMHFVPILQLVLPRCVIHTRTGFAKFLSATFDKEVRHRTFRIRAYLHPFGMFEYA